MEARVKHATDALIAAGIHSVWVFRFVDGILLHQILQWHHMLSSVRPAHRLRLRANMVWDGLFDASTWVLAVGLVLLWQVSVMMFLGRQRPSSSLLIGGGHSIWSKD